MRKYIFDIDGTLTPSRLPMDKGFEKFFTNWISNKNVYLVTGSDKAKTVEQIGTRVWSNVTKVYQSCGNQVWKNGKLISENDFSLTKEMENELIIFLKNTTWKEKFGNHVEQRVGLVNFSIIGRNCPQNKRTEYYNWDNTQKERLNICNRLMQLFPEIEASVGGEISIDIHKRGGNKSCRSPPLPGSPSFVWPQLVQTCPVLRKDETPELSIAPKDILTKSLIGFVAPFRFFIKYVNQ